MFPVVLAAILPSLMDACRELTVFALPPNVCGVRVIVAAILIRSCTLAAARDSSEPNGKSAGLGPESVACDVLGINVETRVHSHVADVCRVLLG